MTPQQRARGVHPLRPCGYTPHDDHAAFLRKFSRGASCRTDPRGSGSGQEPPSVGAGVADGTTPRTVPSQPRRGRCASSAGAGRGRWRTRTAGTRVRPREGGSRRLPGVLGRRGGKDAEQVFGLSREVRIEGSELAALEPAVGKCGIAFPGRERRDRTHRHHCGEALGGRGTGRRPGSRSLDRWSGR